MYGEKHFIIHQRLKDTTVNRSPDMGMILRRPEIREIVSSFGSSIIGLADASIEIVPPIPKKELPKLGEALVELVRTLDTSDPYPTYRIT
jgi:hypothetical protein